MQKTVLVVDDEPDLTEIISFPLDQLGLKAIRAHSGTEAWKIFEEHKNIDLVISDVRMPSGSGIELLKKIRLQNAHIPVILMSGFADVMEDEAKNLGASVLLQKPMELSEIGAWVQKLLKL